ncbi:hypothetical protein DFO80_13610 [Rhodobacter sp. 140A]|nr:hypothetical protein DFO80_13610 [Rhodobacter sp. 140A]
MSDMLPSDPAPLPEVRFLKILVTALAVTMILGLVTIVGLLVTRLSGPVPLPELPEAVVLPEGVRPVSLAFAGNRIVVLSADDRVLVYLRDGTLLGETRIAPAPGTVAP